MLLSNEQSGNLFTAHTMMKLIATLLMVFIWGTSHAQTPSFIFVFLHARHDNPELPKTELGKLMEGHLANIERLASEGKLLVAGPFEGGGGIFIFNSTSMSEVNEWLSTDPGVQAKRWRLELFPYIPRVGSACAAKEPYEMVTYQFIRYTSTITKFNVQKAGETFKKHDDYLARIVKTGNVVAEGVFDNADGGILVMRGDVDEELITADPAMEDGMLEIDFKKLWIAKGSFCEKN